MRIGVDVGGTNTDAALLDGAKVCAAWKAPTSEDVKTGVMAALREVMSQAEIAPERVKAVSIGTTQFTNAFVQARDLVEVAAVRIGLPSSASLAPFVDWPEPLRQAVGGQYYLTRGGHEFDGRELAALDISSLCEIGRDIKRKGIRSIALVGVFSPLNGEVEQRAAACFREICPEFSITLSADLGRLGLIERENAAIMNASLSDLARRVVGSFREALRSMRIAAPCFISQNDGTLLSAERVERHPVLTFASGPTNSMRGAAFLTGLANAIVVDIGGTTTDVGVLTKGFPRESAVATDIGGVRTNFRMPDILSIGLGGGSRVREAPQLSIGPDSVGLRLTKEALVFGGDTMTTTDIVVASGGANIGDKSRVAELGADLCRAATDLIHHTLEEAIDRVRTSAASSPIILVGGGGILVTRPLRGASEVVVPEHASVANAIGAALSTVAGEIDRVSFYGATSRETVLQKGREEAIARAIEAGAVPKSVSILDIEEVPLAYLPGGAVRLRVKAVGELAQ